MGIRKEKLMQTLVIYDNTEFIISQMSGDVREPVGIPFMWLEVPEGKYIVGVDITGEEHEPIYEEYYTPKSETDLLSERVDNLTVALAEVIGGVTNA